jgi:hypothetical protein
MESMKSMTANSEGRIIFTVSGLRKSRGFIVCLREQLTMDQYEIIDNFLNSQGNESVSLRVGEDPVKKKGHRRIYNESNRQTGAN